MIKEILTEDLVEIDVEVKDREDAIKIGGSLLEKKGFIKKEYIQAMIENLQENGPYIVLAPGIAFPHARPEYGAEGIGFSILKLKNPIEFGHNINDPVNLVICISAIDHKTHLEAFSELVEVMADEKKLDNILKSKTKSELLSNF